MAHPSLTANHEKHLTDLSTERLVRLVQAQHQQLCLAAQLVFSVYQQYTRFAKRPPFMCSFRSIRKSIIKDIFRQPPGLELSPDDCRYGLVPAAQLTAEHVRLRIRHRADPDADVVPRPLTPPFAEGTILRRQMQALLAVDLPTTVYDYAGDVGLDYETLVNTIFAYALTLDFSGPTLAQARPQPKSADWHTAWYSFVKVYTTGCSHVVSIGPSSGLGLILTRLRASIEAKLRLSPPLATLRLEVARPMPLGSPLLQALRDVPRADAALQGALDTFPIARGAAEQDPDAIRQQFSVFLDCSLPTHLIVLPPALHTAYCTLAWVARVYMHTLFPDVPAMPSSITLPPSSLPLDFSAVALFVLPFAAELARVTDVADGTPLAVAYRNFVRAGFNVDYPGIDITEVSSSGEASLHATRPLPRCALSSSRPGGARPTSTNCSTWTTTRVSRSATATASGPLCPGATVRYSARPFPHSTPKRPWCKHVTTPSAPRRSRRRTWSTRCALGITFSLSLARVALSWPSRCPEISGVEARIQLRLVRCRSLHRPY